MYIVLYFRMSCAFDQDTVVWYEKLKLSVFSNQGCISCGTCSYPELTEDHVLTSAYFKIFRTVTRNAVNKSVWRKKDCSWPPLNKYAMNIWLSSLRIRAHLSWRTGKHLHVLHVLRTYSTCSYPGYQDTTTYAALFDTLTSPAWADHWPPASLLRDDGQPFQIDMLAKIVNVAPLCWWSSAICWYLANLKRAVKL